ncbi:hypothetical protein K8I61_15485 [bacterium]|nr:hypothetical protein [bacterium]
MKNSGWMLMAWAFAIFAAALGGCSCGDDDDDDDDAADDDAEDDDADDDDDAEDDDADDDADDDDDDADDDDDVLFPFTIDFEDYELGDLSLPWSILGQGGISTAQVDVLVKDGAGQALHISGGKNDGDWIWPSYGFLAVEQSAWIEAEIWRETDAAWGFFVQEFPSNIGQLKIDLSAAPDGGINVQDGGLIDCEVTHTAGEWVTVRLDIDFGANTFDVYVNDGLTSCVDITMQGDSAKGLGGVSFIDYVTATVGGNFYVDNLMGDFITK